MIRRKKSQQTMEHEGDGDTNYDWCTWNIYLRNLKTLKSEDK